MTTLKKGDEIKEGNGLTRKVMEVCGIILHISAANNRNRFSFTSDEESLKELGYTWDTPAWEPEFGQRYWFIYANAGVDVSASRWHNDNVDLARRDFLGIFETKGLAEEALSEIKRKLSK